LIAHPRIPGAFQPESDHGILERAATSRVFTDQIPEAVMSKDTNSVVRIELTDEQKRQFREQTGKEADGLEFSVEQLEERIAPMKTIYYKLGPI
jgi:hypothetical protein